MFFKQLIVVMFHPIKGRCCVSNLGIWQQQKVMGKIFSNTYEVHITKTSLLIMSSFLASTLFGDGMRTIVHAMIFSNSRVMGMRKVHMEVSKGQFLVSRL